MELEAVFLGIFSLISSIISRGMASTNSTIAFSSGVGHHLARISRIRITLETSLQCPQDFKIHRHYLDNLTSWAAQSGILVGNNYTLENVKDGIDIQIPAGADFSVENVFSNFTCNGSDVKVKNDLPEAPSPLSNLFKNFDNLSNALTDFFKLSILTSPHLSDEQHLQHNLSGTGVGDTASYFSFGFEPVILICCTLVLVLFILQTKNHDIINTLFAKSSDSTQKERKRSPLLSQPKNVEEIKKLDNDWFRIANGMLNRAGIALNGSASSDIHVKNPRFFERVLKEGSMGLGESYMDGWWECDRIDIFIHKILKAGLPKEVPRNLKDILRIIVARLMNLQTKARAWIVGKEHYDLGNDLFSRMLDPYMQYSCGYWKEADNLEDAQQHKLKMICEKLQHKPGMSLLDIGCGWGGLAEYAARHHGVSVVGITISAEQRKKAQDRCSGLDVVILLQDYRDLHGRFDRIVSVGMFEHVGPKNYRTFFSVVDHNLAPGGLFLLQTIGSNTMKYNCDPWTSKYIFPNGFVPTISQIVCASGDYFVLEDLHNFGADYDKTLMAWYERFLKAWPEISEKYDERFKRMFTYYLNCCAGAFRARDLQLWQLMFSRGIENGLRVYR